MFFKFLKFSVNGYILFGYLYVNKLFVNKVKLIGYLDIFIGVIVSFSFVYILFFFGCFWILFLICILDIFLFFLIVDWLGCFC